MTIAKQLVFLLALTLACGLSKASEALRLQRVAPDVYAIVGELGNRSAENLGNNATFGFVVTSAGVVLIDSGGTYQGALQIDAMIESVTDQPVVTVINTGGQDHRWLGNDYFRRQGARIIASAAAVADQQSRARDQLIMLGNLVGRGGLEGTEPAFADKTFADRMSFTSGDTRFEIHHAGQAHTPGDSFVWLPRHGVMFSGDIVYVKRMLGVGAQSSSSSWIDVFRTMAAYEPVHLVPGHGPATTLAEATSDTLDYLVFLRGAVEAFMEDGGDIADIGSIDQSRFRYLLNHETLAGRNAQQVFTEMEWE